MKTVKRIVVGEFEVNEITTDEMGGTDTTFVFQFCPRGLGSIGMDDLIRRGAIPTCKFDCDYWPGCSKAPEFSEWSGVLENTVARDYLEE
jgi:hypothetical protein